MTSPANHSWLAFDFAVLAFLLNFWSQLWLLEHHLFILFLVGAIKCFSCVRTQGWVMDHSNWGVDRCDFQVAEAEDCSQGPNVEDAPTYCYTDVESFDQEDFSGFRETRGCDDSNNINGGGIQYTFFVFHHIYEQKNFAM